MTARRKALLLRPAAGAPQLRVRWLQRSIFANYYAGLNELLLGRHERAGELLRKAVASKWGQTAEGGPSYMWQIARLHSEENSRQPRG